MKGGTIYSPIRDANPCLCCKPPERYPGCHGKCEKHAAWKAEIERVNKNRRDYAKDKEIGWRKK